MPSLKARIAALERPFDKGACLVCALAWLDGTQVTNCTHPPGITMIDILESLDKKPEQLCKPLKEELPL